MKLLLADDHTLFRDALVEYIKRAEPEADVVLAKDFDEAFEELKKQGSFDLVLLDLKMPGMQKMEGLKAVREHYPDTRVALISGIAEKSDVNEAMELGAVAYFPKTLSGRALMKAIQLVLSGEKFVPFDHATNEVMESYRADAEEEEIQQVDVDKIKELSLTPREAEVLSHLANGASNKEIATALGVQVVTIKLHVRGVCQKLNAKNRTQAALKAKELGLVA